MTFHGSPLGQTSEFAVTDRPLTALALISLGRSIASDRDPYS